MIELNIEIRKKIARAMKLLRIAILGDRLAEIFDCTQSNISQAEKHGHGEIKKVVSAIYEAQMAVGKSCTVNQSDDAVHAVVTVINEVAGYHAFKPLRHNHDIRGILEAARSVMSDSSEVIGEIQESIDEEGELGKEISAHERDRIAEACDKGIEHLAALKEFAIANCIQK